MKTFSRPLISCLVAALSPAADFSGSVLSSDGKPINAEILLTGLGRHQSFQTPSGKMISRPLPGAGPRRAVVRLQADGAFNLRGLSDGEYLVCVKVASPYLNPCDWGPPAGFRVQNGRVSGAVALRLQPGAVIDIRVEDPNRSLPNAPDTVRSSAISIGIVTSDGRYVPATQTARGSTRAHIQRYGSCGFDVQALVFQSNRAIARGQPGPCLPAWNAGPSRAGRWCEAGGAADRAAVLLNGKRRHPIPLKGQPCPKSL